MRRNMKKNILITAIVLLALVPAMVFAEATGTPDSLTTTTTVTLKPAASSSYAIGFATAVPTFNAGLITSVNEVTDAGYVLTHVSGQTTAAAFDGYVYWKLISPSQCYITLKADGPLKVTAGAADDINYSITPGSSVYYLNGSTSPVTNETAGSVIGGTTSGTVSYSTVSTIHSVASNTGLGASDHGYARISIATESLTGHQSSDHKSTMTLSVVSSL